VFGLRPSSEGTLPLAPQKFAALAGKRMNKQEGFIMTTDSRKENSRQSRDAALSNLIEQVQNEKTKDYITNRIVPQMEWYSSKSRSYKKKYFRWMTAVIMIGAFVPVVSVFADGSIWVKALLAALGAGTTACNAYLSLQNYKDLWLTYRKTREAVLRTLYFYFNNIGVFSQSGTQEEKDAHLITICENELSSETDGWQSSIEK